MSPRLRRARKEPAEQPPPASSSEPSVPPAAEPTVEPAVEPTVEPTVEPAARPARRPTGERRRAIAHATPVLLLRSAHPRVGALTAAGLALAAALSGRPGREVALVLATALIGQAILGWLNDLVDRKRDAERLPSGKPIADGYLEPSTAWFALICAVLLLVPVAVTNGVVAGSLYLGSVALGALGNVALRRGWLSWVPWAAAYALYPGFLSYGGWGGQATGSAPQPAMVALAAALGVGVHVLCALPGLVADHEDGVRHLPLRLALRTGATRLLVAALVWTVLALTGLLVVGAAVGLSR